MVKNCTFHVVEASGPVILGLPTCRTLGLVTLHYDKSEAVHIYELEENKGSAVERDKVL